MANLREFIEKNKMLQFNPGNETEVVFGGAGMIERCLCVYPTTISVVACLRDPVMFVVF